MLRTADEAAFSTNPSRLPPRGPVLPKSRSFTSSITVRCTAGAGPGLAVVVLELMLARSRNHCRPPLPETEVVQVVNSIARLHERKAREQP